MFAPVHTTRTLFTDMAKVYKETPQGCLSLTALLGWVDQPYSKMMGWTAAGGLGGMQTAPKAPLKNPQEARCYEWQSIKRSPPHQV